jgi:hypothetical protein
MGKRPWLFAIVGLDYPNALRFVRRRCQIGRRHGGLDVSVRRDPAYSDAGQYHSTHHNDDRRSSAAMRFRHSY